ncbi:MAG: DUF2927 domain-containing protein [Leptolyngbyaceae cyanobacterium bins.59]|nr:DUF2927 domain-containing protein [Leptolyngbyaceae cyanobacterium bins.59]
MKDELKMWIVRGFLLLVAMGVILAYRLGAILPDSLWSRVPRWKFEKSPQGSLRGVVYYPERPLALRTTPTQMGEAKGDRLHVGDSVEVVDEMRDPEGCLWAKLETQSGKTGWVRRSQLRLQMVDYTQEEQLEYFLEIALGGEFRFVSPQIRKWLEPVRIQVYGNPTPQDRQTLREVLCDLNGVTGEVQLSLVEDKPNVRLYFVPESDFARYEPNYRPVNYGFFWVQWDDRHRITQAKILISTEGINQQERSHLIREEITQSLGLMQDSYRDQRSIFYQPWTTTTEYADIDWALIELLYYPQVLPGMTRSQLLQILRKPDKTLE